LQDQRYVPDSRQNALPTLNKVSRIFTLDLSRKLKLTPLPMSSLKDKLYDHLRDDVYCKLGVSGIHGIGVFAIRDIPKGTAPLRSMVSNKEIKFSRIELKKVPSSVRKHLSRFCLVEKGRVFAPEIGLNAVNVSIYLNHSKKPNLRFDDKDVLRAVRDIERGDELTIDYDVSFDDDHDFSDN